MEIERYVLVDEDGNEADKDVCDPADSSHCAQCTAQDARRPMT